MSIDTARCRSTTVICAVVAVVAIGRLCTKTRSIGAHRGRGARVAVVTVRNISGVLASRDTTAVVRAWVVVVTGQPRTWGACALLTAVPDGARVAIVTVDEVRLILTTLVCVAEFVRALVPVVADQRLTNANSILAVVGLGAGVAVQTLPRVQGGVHAAIRPVAAVLGAGISVVAGTLVHDPIAVIVAPVAFLRSGLEGVAGLQTELGAHSVAFAASVLVLHPTRCGEAPLLGEVRAATNPNISEALVALSTSGCVHLLAVIALWTWVIEIARASAKAETVWILHTSSRGLPRATIGRLTGQTEARKVRNADVLTIRASAPNQGTRPT